MMYRWRGQPLSVFVVNTRLRTGRREDDNTETEIDKFGEHAIIWSRGDRTYAVVARDPSPSLTKSLITSAESRSNRP